MSKTDFDAIQTLLTEKPELAQRLEGVTSRLEGSQRLAAIAAENGIPAEAGEIEREIDQRMKRAAESGELSDVQLETIAGGSELRAESLSVLGFAAVCAAHRFW